jgi:T-complex protein 1 subunit gamma
MQELAVDAVRQVMRDINGDKREVEIKKYAKVEKIPGGAMQDCRVINGVMFTKDVVSPERMRRSIQNPRILLLDCPLEYKKGENQTAVELVNEADFAELLQQEEEVRSQLCGDPIAARTDANGHKKTGDLFEWPVFIAIGSGAIAHAPWLCLTQ